MSEKSYATELPPTHLFRSSRSSGKTVAVVAPSYGLERVSYVIPATSHHYVKLRRLPLQRLERHGNYYEQTPIIIGPQVDLVHCFNMIPANRAFVTTVEMELPRFFGRISARQRQRGMRFLASDRCRGIWPLSEAARAYVARRFERGGHGELVAKLQVFRGAVPPLDDGADRVGYDSNGPLKLLFVGGQGLHKGLGPSVAAAEALRSRGLELELTIVGKATSSTFVVPGQEFDTSFLARAVAAHRWITHYPALSNREVRALMGRHDLLVFPSIDESLGWVVAEAAMSGTPAITTDIFALPELTLAGRSGWLIDLPKDEDGRWLHRGRPDSRRHWDDAQAHITASLIEIISDIAADRTLIEAYGSAARRHITMLYSFDVAAPKLSMLYEAALR